MITIDKRFNDEEMAILRQLIGKKIVSFRHDEFNFNNSSSQVVGIESEYGMIYLYSFTEPLDYYGSVEDVAVWKLTDEQYKFVDKKNLIKSPVNETVDKIQIIQENQRLFEGSKQTYNVWVTRGIIFHFGDHQYSFEKPVWFSEDIYIQKGYDLIKSFASTDKFVNDDWNADCIAECERESVIVNAPPPIEAGASCFNENSTTAPRNCGDLHSLHRRRFPCTPRYYMRYVMQIFA